MAEEKCGNLKNRQNAQNEKTNDPMEDVDKLLKKQLEKEKEEEKKKKEEEKKTKGMKMEFEMNKKQKKDEIDFTRAFSARVQSFECHRFKPFTANYPDR